MITMDVNQFNEKYLALHEDTKKAIKELEDLTGKKVVFRLIKREEAQTFFKLKIKLARKIMDNHVIIINEDNVDNKNELNYYIVHEAVHGLRLFKGDESYRKVLKVHSDKIEELNNKLLSEILPKLNASGLNINQFKDYCAYLANNIFQLFANASVDARIEIYISKHYPGLAKMQKQAQKKYAKEILESFDKNKTYLIPDWILTRVNAVNYAYLTKITPIIGKSWISKANSNMSKDFKCLIDKLMVDLETLDNGQVTDIETLNSWAKILEVEDYIFLDDFENIDIFYILSN